jgi:protoheme IX farnesyltransferase
MTAAEQPTGATWRDTLNAYWRLTKPGVITLLLVTTLGAMFVAQHGVPAPGLIAATLLGGGLAAAAANAMNSYLERDLDKLMHRTSRRPMPRALVPPNHALIFSITLAVVSMLILTLAVNWLSAGMAALGYLGYVFLYTLWLKRATPQNVVIGGIAGALPPLVGYAAVAGHLDLTALYLFAIIFWWTPPHTWALTIMVADDYARGAVPMLPVAVGAEETTRHILWYSALLVVVTLLPVLAGLAGALYLVVALALNAWQLRLAWQLAREPNKALARTLYKYSLLYLTLVYAAYVADRLLAR